MSSLGDVVQTLAAVTDAARCVPGIQFDWVVEEAYAQLAAWHPAVRRVIPVALRRWRRSVPDSSFLQEWFRFRRELRRERYDLVLDAQGLYKSAWIARQARGPVAGRSIRTAREGLAAVLYSRRYSVPQVGPEVEQVRKLFALALGYPQPQEPARFGLDPEAAGPSSRAGDYTVFFHGAAWETKLWSEANWVALARFILDGGISVLLPWGSEEERQRAERIAKASGAEVLPKMGVAALTSIIAHARFVVGLDTGLTHLAVALSRPTLTLYGPTTPVYGAVAAPLVNLSSSADHTIDTRRPNTVPLERAVEAVRLNFLLR